VVRAIWLLCERYFYLLSFPLFNFKIQHLLLNLLNHDVVRFMFFIVASLYGCFSSLFFITARRRNSETVNTKQQDMRRFFFKQKGKNTK
jgi:hypothetical protein